MISERLEPSVSFHSDELSQGYFARLGTVHAGVNARQFCSYVGLGARAFRNGDANFVELTAALSGIEPEVLKFNTVQLQSDGAFSLRGETLDVSTLRRTKVHYCPECLNADAKSSGPSGAGLFRQRWIWQLRPVKVCPIHCMELASIDSRYGVQAYDLAKLIEQSDVDMDTVASSVRRNPGVLQDYVIDRMNGTRANIPWLDGQGISEGVRACEMIGSLFLDGSQAVVKEYTDTDWAAVGDVGFHVCSLGPEAIKDVLHNVKVSSGRKSGRTGPQAVFGYLYNSIKKSVRTGGLGPIVNVVRESIVENFSIGAGEIVFGEVVTKRKVHSVSSLSLAIGINKFRLFGLARTTGLIPQSVDREASNQLVFPVEEAERVIGRIANSIPQNQVARFLGGSTNQVGHLVRNETIKSITPLVEEHRGQLRGNFNRDDLNEFLGVVCNGLPIISSEVDGYVSLSEASRLRTDTSQVFMWLLDGELPKTCLLQGGNRIDHLRFCYLDVVNKIKEFQGCDLCSLTSAASVLGIRRAAIKRLISTENGGPWLIAVKQRETKKVTKSIFFSHTEIEHFQEMYLTPGLIGRMFGINWSIVSRVLKEKSVDTICDPKWVGAEIYRRDEVLSVASDLEAAHPLPKEGRYKRSKEIAKLNLSGKTKK
ncbi:TniQ family protein [Sulfitobacter guttiformis]|uniref:TniQ protein n=1 Tax=Sulfitobacter guttiformis TaxID=74349 RepID=A0A420DMP4_9RHOB|nr:TniQ family protein [Sulfitobacter guttiformis]KIN72866.1 TniQ domain containing protein [Sulfitobacter guttiformis KCTC 32187]RKE95554.1 TniQ protein [Sulfitobacter guttiformis]